MSVRLALVLLMLALGQPCLAATPETLSYGRFPKILLHAPTGPVARFVILLSDSAGWNAAMDELATTLAADGALVAGVDTPALLQSLADDGDCVDAVGDFENLAHFLQGYRRVPGYFTPLLAGVGGGAALAWATLLQAPAGLFSGFVSLDFCAPQNARCASDEPSQPARLDVPWRALLHTPPACSRADAERLAARASQARLRLVREVETAAALREAVEELAPPASTPRATLDGLPLIEVPAGTPGTRFAVLLSGDGGWAGLDKQVADALATQGLPVVGFDSLRYFWSARTPQGLAADLDRLIRAYAARWRRTEVVLIGYSQGADVLPFAVNRLPPASRRLVSRLVLLGPGARASFEFHLDDWISRDDDGLPLAPELARLAAGETLCVYGKEDEDSICPRLAPTQARLIALPGDHHFDGDYAALAQRILAQLTQANMPAAPGRPSTVRAP